MLRIYVLLAGFLVACAGCGGRGSTVQGTVTIDGQLARQGTVIFHPVEGGPTAYGSIAADGSYAIRVGQGDLSDPNAGDLSPGDYIVTVVVNMPSRPDELLGEAAPPKPGARLSAEKYGNKDTSDLRHAVKPGRNVIPLELEGTSAEGEAAESDATATEPPDDVSEPGAEPAPEVRPTNGEAAPATEPSSAPVSKVDSSSETSEPGANTEEQSQ